MDSRGPFERYSILTGRWVARWCSQHARRTQVVILGVLPLAGLYFLTSLAALHDPIPTNPGRELGPWLKANDLQAGYAPYWYSSIVTVESGEAVTVRPVIGVEKRLFARAHYASEDWFHEEGEAHRFVILRPDSPLRDGVDEESAIGTFGRPARSEQFGEYRILIWDKDLTPLLGPLWRDR